MRLFIHDEEQKLLLNFLFHEKKILNKNINLSPIDDAGLLSLLCLLTIRRVASGLGFPSFGGGGGGGGGGGTDPRNAGARTVGLLLEIASRTGLNRSTS